MHSTLEQKLCSILLLIYCSIFQMAFAQKPLPSKVKATIHSNYTGSYYKGNYVWGGAMNLAWDDLSKTILKEKIKLATKDQAAMSMLSKLNDPAFTKDDLDENSYYIKSGYGPKTVDTINTESRKKFPSKSFSNLSAQLSDRDIIAYAYFLKQVTYLKIFTHSELSFAGQKVAGFYAWTEKERENVRILEYVNDNKFIISLDLQEAGDQLILAKGYNMTDPAIAVKQINQHHDDYLSPMGDPDNFEAPNLTLDHHRDYVELINQPLANKGFENYVIRQMFENVKFKMDEKGAGVESEAEVSMQDLAINPDYQPKPRHFVLDKPFWVVMKRKNSKQPYFILGVNNTELMDKIK